MTLHAIAASAGDAIHEVAAAGVQTFAWLLHPPTMISATYFQALPPSVTDDPFGFAVSLAGLMIVSLIFADWVHRFGWAMLDRPEALHHPRTISRLVFFLTGVSGVIRNGPDVLLWGLWKGVTPLTRYELAHWNRMLDGVSAPFMIVAGLLAVAGVPVIEHQLGRFPIPVDLYPGWRRMARPIAIGVLATMLSFAIAFLG